LYAAYICGVQKAPDVFSTYAIGWL